ncbi:hypothetical protein ACTZWW_03700 [Salinarimonas sp. NSM]|uniref:hypothetical protein n=1 Tax=Salinarimonas sp. NSM TaxID=3458003 RepID=UPI004036D054
MRPLTLFAIPFALLLAAAPATAQDSPDAARDPFVWSDPDTGCAYLVAPGTGITPRLRAEGIPDCPDADVRLGESFERTLREGGEALGGALRSLGDRLETEAQ